MRQLRSWTLQEPEIERREHQDNSGVHYQPLPELVPEEQDVHADHDGYQREHVKHDGCLSSHRFVLLCVTEWEQERQPPMLANDPRRGLVVLLGHLPSRSSSSRMQRSRCDASHRALLTSSKPAPASCSQVAAGGDRWLLTAGRAISGLRPRNTQAGASVSGVCLPGPRAVRSVCETVVRDRRLLPDVRGGAS